MPARYHESCAPSERNWLPRTKPFPLAKAVSRLSSMRIAFQRPSTPRALRWLLWRTLAHVRLWTSQTFSSRTLQPTERATVKAFGHGLGDEWMSRAPVTSRATDAGDGRGRRIAGDRHEPDIEQPLTVDDCAQICAHRLPATIGGRAWVQQAQSTRGHRVPWNVAVPEDEHVGIRKPFVTALFASCGRSRFVYDGEANSLQLHAGDLRQRSPQFRPIIIAVHADEPRGPLHQFFIEADADPVTGMDDDICSIDGTPNLLRQLTGPLRNVGVGQDQEANRQLAHTGHLVLDPAVEGDNDEADRDGRAAQEQEVRPFVVRVVEACQRAGTS